MFRLPNLQRLDTIKVSADERIRAYNLYNSSEGDLSMREEVFCRYLPTEQFIDYAIEQLPIDEEEINNMRLSVESIDSADSRDFGSQLSLCNETVYLYKFNL